MSGLKNVYTKAQKLKPYARKAVQIGRDLAPIAETIAPRLAPGINKGLDFAAELLGMGYTKADIKRMKGMGYSNKDFKKMIMSTRGGNIVGGKMLPKEKMMARIASYR